MKMKKKRGFTTFRLASSPRNPQKTYHRYMYYTMSHLQHSSIAIHNPPGLTTQICTSCFEGERESQPIAALGHTAAFFFFFLFFFFLSFFLPFPSLPSFCGLGLMQHSSTWVCKHHSRQPAYGAVCAWFWPSCVVCHTLSQYRY